MALQLPKKQLVRLLMRDVDEDMVDEDIIHLLLEERVSLDSQDAEQETLAQRAADRLAHFAGSWPFIIVSSVIMLVWVVVNLVFLAHPFDPYPFILLNLVLSCVSALQAPLIMMSQNRQEQKDRQRNESDYKVNLKTELIIEDIHKKLDRLLEAHQLKK